MKIDILCYFEKFNGVFSSLLDLYYNLTLYNISPVTFNIIIHPQSKYIYERSKVDYPEINVNKLITYKYDLLIVSADFILKNYNIFKHIKYNNLIILDSLKIYLDQSNLDNIKKLTNKIILGNKFNSHFFPEDYKIYYHKFSSSRLIHIKQKYYNSLSNKLIRTNEEECFITELSYKTSLHSYNEYNYSRYRSWDNGTTYIENIGKLLFEYLYLGKRVFYSPKNKTMDDGLTEYLSLFGIDDNIEQELILTPQEIEDKLFMKEDDTLLQLIKAYE